MQLLSTLLFITSAAALGINCEGSSLCHINKGATSAKIARQIGNIINDGHGNRYYQSGQQIACTSGFAGSMCAFYQHGGSGRARDAYRQVLDIQRHGCKACGSIPTDGSDVFKGELTLNYVSNPCCQGDCTCA